MINNEDYSPWIKILQFLIVLYLWSSTMNTELALSIGSKIREARKNQSVSQEQLALLTTIDRSYLGRIERGEVSVTVEKLAQIAHVLNVDINNLIP